MMRLPESWTKVTTLSKTIALIMLVTFPTAGFLLGREYQERITPPSYSPIKEVRRTVSPTIAMEPYKNWQIYTDKNNFSSIKYPAGWRVESAMDTFPDLEKAIKGSGNHFSISSYKVASAGGEPVPASELKLEVRLFNNSDKSLKTWIRDDWQANYLKLETFLIGDKYAMKVWGKNMMGKENILNIYFIDGKKAAVFTAWPSNTVYNQELDKMLSSFIFLDELPSSAGGKEGQFCGGITGKVCPSGFTCKLDGNFPDAGGKCVIASPTPVRVPAGQDAIMCTMDARQCPDGTWVGRTAPKCDFVCPGNQDPEK